MFNIEMRLTLKQCFSLRSGNHRSPSHGQPHSPRLLPKPFSGGFPSSNPAQDMCKNIIFGLRGVTPFTRKLRQTWAFAHPPWANGGLETLHHSVRAVQQNSIAYFWISSHHLFEEDSLSDFFLRGTERALNKKSLIPPPSNRAN